MANTMRWRYGETSPVMLEVDATTVIEIGDLLYLDTDDAKPASVQVDQGAESLNQEEFHSKFVGVAMQGSPSGLANPIRVATAGVFEWQCASATFEVGDLVGATENAAADGLENQSVKGVGSINQAIGRCARRVAPATTHVLVDIVSCVMRGGPQPIA